jgi:hypothetical protein
MRMTTKDDAQNRMVTMMAATATGSNLLFADALLVKTLILASIWSSQLIRPFTRA